MIARILSGLVAAVLISPLATAQTMTVQEAVITDYRPVVARIEATDSAEATSRLQGVVTRLTVDEGQTVKAGEVIAVVIDEKIAPQISALTSRIEGLTSQIEQQEEDLARAETLLDDGFYPRAQFEREQTALNVLKTNRTAARQERQSVSARRSEGEIRSPADARVTDVLIVEGSVVSPGQVIARLATLGGLVRISLPERHLSFLEEGKQVSLRLPARDNETRTARIEKIYPALRDGAVIADAVVDGGLNALVGERADVLVPVGDRRAIVIPREFVTTRYGVDFVSVRVGERFVEAPVVLAEPLASTTTYEILSGLRPGDVIAAAETESS
ncbi:efflux RND transporter periplasmic adaptor subunit [Henriciella sp.]|uniref:efflux RND transporter periplasmic adaptor subunit n=1 Tax=Henriciella sp. TaxID=1968823 RepID=UPI00262734F2|nr:efflux RND transporter periplasmic adaptor subunit [Henriciella sp.]